MKIIFYADKSGLGNNGGTKTIIKSAMTLQKIGHEVDIVSTVNHFKLCEYDLNIVRDITDYDAIVAVGLNDALFLFGDYKNKYWWVRGWEAWHNGNEYFVNVAKGFVKSGGKIICNAEWLVDKFKEYKIESKLCYSGLDFDMWVNGVK